MYKIYTNPVNNLFIFFYRKPQQKMIRTFTSIRSANSPNSCFKNSLECELEEGSGGGIIWWTVHFYNNSRQLAAVLFSDVSVFIKLFWRVCGFKISFCAMILCPRRQDRRGPIVCVSHSARQNSVVGPTVHGGQKPLPPASVPAKFQTSPACC